jgi:tetratricopeptide (TPR) repeat protein
MSNNNLSVKRLAPEDAGMKEVGIGRSAATAPMLRVSVGGLLLICLGCTQFPEQARRSIVEGTRAYEGRQYAAAAAALDAVIRDHPAARESAEAYYVRALCRIRQGRPADARSDLDRCLDLSIRPDLTARAWATRGAVEYDAGAWDRAAEMFEKALRDLPEQPPTDQVRYRCGTALQRLGRWDDARAMYAALLHHYPDSPHASEARRRFSWNRAYFAIQCGAFANESQADALLGKIRSVLPDTRRESEARMNRPMFLVYAGRYPTYVEAERGLPQVRKHVPGAFIVP